MMPQDAAGFERSETLFRPVDFSPEQAYYRFTRGTPLFPEPVDEANFVPAWQDGVTPRPRRGRGRPR